MWTDWKIDVAMVDSMGDPLHNVMHSMGTDSVMGWNTVCYTSQNFCTIGLTIAVFHSSLKPPLVSIRSTNCIIVCKHVGRI